VKTDEFCITESIEKISSTVVAFADKQITIKLKSRQGSKLYYDKVFIVRRPIELRAISHYSAISVIQVLEYLT
jgi:hypothetical protein